MAKNREYEARESLSLMESELRKAQEWHRLIGDPRKRVEVPADGEATEKPSYSTNRRYAIG